MEAVEPEPQPVPAERVRHDDPRAGLEVTAVDPPDDLRLADVPDLRRIAELEAGREQHRAHRTVGDDRPALVEERPPAGIGRTRLRRLALDDRSARRRTRRDGVGGIGGTRPGSRWTAGSVAGASLGALAHQRLIER
jgi:hypothetical protein